MFQTTLLTDSHVERIAAGVLKVLEDVGVSCENEDILRALEQAGARVNRAVSQVFFPRSLVTDFVDTLRSQGSTDPGNGHRLFSPPSLPSLGVQVAQFFLDHETGLRRSGNKQDFITLVKLGNVLHGAYGVGHALLLREAPPLLEPLEAALLLAEYADRPSPAFAWHVSQAEYLAEMGEVLGLHDWYTWGAICFAHPLRFDKHVAERFVRCAREGRATGLTAMPVAGISTPITVEGFTVVSSAEHVATWIAARALNPNVPLTGSQWAATVDMKTGHVSYSSFDAMFYSFVSVEFLRRWCGLCLAVGGGEYCDAREPGLYAALEKAYKAMTVAAFTGQHPSVGQGMLEVGKTLSPVQLMIERDLVSGIQQYGRTVDPSDDTIPMDTILAVGSGWSANYLPTDHTLAHFRSSCWIPGLIDRSGWKGPESEVQVVEAARSRVQQAVASYRRPEGREAQLGAMREIVERAKRKLLG